MDNGITYPKKNKAFAIPAILLLPIGRPPGRPIMGIITRGSTKTERNTWRVRLSEAVEDRESFHALLVGLRMARSWDDPDRRPYGFPPTDDSCEASSTGHHRPTTI